MTIDLDAIRARCKALDERLGEGPWTLERSTRYPGLFSVYDSDGNVVSHGVEEEQSFIVHSRADVPALVAEAERLRAELVSEHGLMIMYSDRDAATRRKLQEIGAIASHEEITSLDAIERLGRELHDEQVRRDAWEKMYEEMGLVVELEPDALPCGHPRDDTKEQAQ